jgi:hypothetical protein
LDRVHGVFLAHILCEWTLKLRRLSGSRKTTLGSRSKA